MLDIGAKPDGASFCLEVKSAKDLQMKFNFGSNTWEANKDMGPHGSNGSAT
jgi:hypothetical protein